MATKWNYTIKNGKSAMSSYVKNSLLQSQKENEGGNYQINLISAESKKQRGFFEGAIIPLWVFLDGHDHRDSKINKHYREKAKEEFNGDIIIRNGKEELIGLSTKGILPEFTEKIISYLEENYGIKREEVLNSKHCKNWRDTIYSLGKSETYIDYLVEIGRLKKQTF